MRKDDGTPYKIFTPFYRKGCLKGPVQPRLVDAQPGKFVRSLDQCTERFTSELSCNGYKVLLSRVDQPGLDFWDVLVRIRSENSTTDDYPPPSVAVEGRASEQISHNAAYLCNEDKLVLYGGRVKPDGRKGHYPGMVRMEGTLSDSGVAWSEPMVILDAERAKSLEATRTPGSCRPCGVYWSL